MQTLVDSRQISIKVKDVSGMCVCTQCKGAKTLWYNSYFDSNALYSGGLYSISKQVECPKCQGRGYWKENE